MMADSRPARMDMGSPETTGFWHDSAVVFTNLQVIPVLGLDGTGRVESSSEDVSRFRFWAIPSGFVSGRGTF